MWKKLEKDNLKYFCNQGNKSDLNLFKEFVINNEIEYIFTTMIKGPLYDFM